MTAGPTAQQTQRAVALAKTQYYHRLQRTAGNAAVAQMLAASSAASAVEAGPMRPGRPVSAVGTVRFTQPSHGRRTSSPVVQRNVAWKTNNHTDNLLDGFVATLDQLVQNSARAALDPDGLPDLDGYLVLWKDTAIILRAIEDQEIDNDDPDAVAEARAAAAFAYARFGYAVESLACAESGRLTAALPGKCSYQLQGSRGMTRPDIIIRHSENGEIAWLDITSEASIGHIDRKTGSGWKDKPYVAEVVYPQLVKSDIGASRLGIGERVARRNAMKRRMKAWDDTVRKVVRRIRREWDEEQGDAQNEANKRSTIRGIIAGVVGAEVSPQQTKSVLRAVALSPKDYGYKYNKDKKGGTKSEGETILRGVFGV